MAYKSILTVLTAGEAAGPAPSVAARIALAEDAHLEVLALGIDRTQLEYTQGGGMPALVQLAYERAGDEARAAEAAANAAMQAQDSGLRWSVEPAVAQLGSLTQAVAQRARFNDLVVLNRPYGKGQGREAEAVLEAALFEGQSPVLVLPDALADGATLGRRVVVAWDQSREALAAVRHALPFLISADLVNIVVIDPPQHGPERSDPGGRLCQMLVRHGVKAEVSVLARTMPRVSDVLARHVLDRDADLLVMGAYGHSRLREALLGGATRDMLEQACVPVLMAH